METGKTQSQENQDLSVLETPDPSNAIYTARMELLHELVPTPEELKQFKALLNYFTTDAFFVHYHPYPKLDVDKKDVLPLQYRLIEEYTKTEDYAKLRRLTVHSSPLSLTYAAILRQKLIEELLRDQELRQSMEQYMSSCSSCASASSSSNTCSSCSIQPQGRQDKQGSPQQPRQHAQKQHRLQQEQQGAYHHHIAQQLRDLVEKIKERLGDVLKKVAREAVQKAQLVQELWGIGFSELQIAEVIRHPDIRLSQVEKAISLGRRFAESRNQKIVER